jgi:hypothetical protein
MEPPVHHHPFPFSLAAWPRRCAVVLLRREHDHWIRNGGLWREDRTPKPAATRLTTLWTRTWNTTAALGTLRTVSSGSSWAFRGFYGRYNYSVTYGGRTYRGTVRFPRSAGARQTVTVNLV